MPTLRCLALGAVLVAATACSAAEPGASPVPALTPQQVVAASPSPSPAATPAPRGATAYEDLVLADGPVGFWPLTDVADGMRLGQRAGDLAGGDGAVNADGALDRTDGPVLGGLATDAASFRASGRLVTGVTSGLSSAQEFTVELWFRADGCTTSWGRIAGTEVADAAGRQGLNLFHYPVGTKQACRVGVEVWQDDQYVVGCPKGAAAPEGVWRHYAVSYGDGVLSCYADGVLFGKQRPQDLPFVQGGAFGIGAAGSGYAGSLASGSLAAVAVHDRALSAERLALRSAR